MAVNLTTVAPVASPQVGTFMAADVGDLRTLVNIHTTLANMFESRFADASVGARVVLTLGVDTTHESVDPPVAHTLVNVLADTVHLLVTGATLT